MTSNYGEIVSGVVKAFGVKYRMSMAERDDMESAIIVRLATVAQEPEIDAKLNEEAYLKTAVLNTARNCLKSLIRERDRLAILSEYHELAAEECDPEDDILIQELLESLSYEQNRVVSTYYGLDGLPPVKRWQDIAQYTGYSRQQCKRYYDSAMTKLKRLCQ
jgi:DNA-directed RNA polymerase specialized sigma24 family protein